MDGVLCDFEKRLAHKISLRFSEVYRSKIEAATLSLVSYNATKAPYLRLLLPVISD